MNHVNFILSILFLFSYFYSCNRSQEKLSANFDTNLEKKLSINREFHIGDVRRYGLFPEKSDKQNIYNKTQNPEAIFRLASTGLKIYFPPGYYNHALILENIKNINLYFNHAEFGSVIQIKNAENIHIEGHFISYNMLEINRSKKIFLDTIQIINNPSLHSGRRESSGIQILYNSSDIHIHYAQIYGLGSGKNFKYIHAALKIYGYPELPQDVYIDKVIIKNSAVHGAIIMGHHIIINKMIIDGYGMKPNNYLIKLSHVSDMPKNYYALWLQKNTLSEYTFIEIPKVNRKAMRLGPGNIYQPTLIDTLSINYHGNLDEIIDDDKNTNIIVKHVIIH